MAAALSKSGYEVTVFTRARSAYPVDPDLYSFKIKFVKGRHWRQLRTWYCYRTMRDFLKHHQVDAVIATTWNVARGIVALTEKQGIPCITVVHGLEVTRKMAYVKKQWVRQTLMASRFVIAVSRFTKEQIMTRYQIPSGHVHVIPNGVNASVYTPGRDVSVLRRQLNISKEKVILTLARVIERKGHEQVIRALADVRQTIPHVKYIIAGPWDEKYYSHLERLTAKLQLTQCVHFTGYLETGVLADYYNLCDVYIMVSQTLQSAGDTEGFGITYLEANACEKPVIGGHSGGVVDAIIDGETGFLVDPRDIDAITDRLVRLLQDPGLAGRMGKAGRERIMKGMTWDAIAGSVSHRIFPASA